jgi:hypothetical protein
MPSPKRIGGKTEQKERWEMMISSRGMSRPWGRSMRHQKPGPKGSSTRPSKKNMVSPEFMEVHCEDRDRAGLVHDGVERAGGRCNVCHGGKRADRQGRKNRDNQYYVPRFSDSLFNLTPETSSNLSPNHEHGSIGRHI